MWHRFLLLLQAVSIERVSRQLSSPLRRGILWWWIRLIQLSLVEKHSGQPLPQVIVRNNLPALISRNVYYQLIDWALEASDGNTDKLYISSMGERFLLGLG